MDYPRAEFGDFNQPFWFYRANRQNHMQEAKRRMIAIHTRHIVCVSNYIADVEFALIRIRM